MKLWCHVAAAQCMTDSDINQFPVYSHCCNHGCLLPSVCQNTLEQNVVVLILRDLFCTALSGSWIAIMGRAHILLWMPNKSNLQVLFVQQPASDHSRCQWYEFSYSHMHRYLKKHLLHGRCVWDCCIGSRSCVFMDLFLCRYEWSD